MSHFVCMVAIRGASDVHDAQSHLDDLLEPFNENLVVEAYFEEADKETVDRAIAFYRENPDHCGENGDGPSKPFDEFVTEGNLTAFEEWTRQAVGGYCAGDPDRGIRKADSDAYGYKSTYNPQSKWDWWSLGGRWHGYFQMKPDVRVGSDRESLASQLGPVGDGRVSGEKQIQPASEIHTAILGGGGVFGDDPDANFTGRADLARKGDIDFEGARTLAQAEAELTYDKFEAATKNIPVPIKFSEMVDEEYAKAGIDPNDWENFMPDLEIKERRKRHKAPIDAARNRWHTDPWVKALREAELMNVFGDIHDDFCVGKSNPRQHYIERAVNNVHVPFALLIDGEWIEKGHMGWFGMSSDDKDPDEWNRQVAHLLDSLPDDAYLAAVDCHI